MAKVKIQCQYKIDGVRPCLNDALEDSLYCHPHNKKRSVMTPGGQKVFRSGGILDLAPRLAKERDVNIPEDSAGIEGFPYTRVPDLEAYRRWKAGQAESIDSHDILERFPLDVYDAEGSEMDGDEIAIYDNYGTVWELAKEESRNIVIEESVSKDGITTTLYQTKSGHPFAVISNQKYQFVRLDEDILNRSILSNP